MPAMPMRRLWRLADKTSTRTTTRERHAAADRRQGHRDRQQHRRPVRGLILAALGADVLKVERPDGGDDARGWGPPFWRGTSATFHALNVNKRGLTLDLKDPAQIAQIKVLLSEADVLVHNLRPGVLEGLGLGSAALGALNPRLVYCAISAFGAKGPMQRHPGYEPMVQAFAGLFSINGYPDRPGVRMGTSVLESRIGDMGRARLHRGPPPA